MRLLRPRVVGLAACWAVMLAFVAAPAGGQTDADWSAYLGGPLHTSEAGDGTVTVASAASLTHAWTFHPQPLAAPRPTSALFASPVVVGGVVYEGANSGIFYALDLTTGNTLWSTDLGYQAHHTCTARGIASTATVADDPVSGTQTVYVASGDGYLYALDAATGSVVWKSLVMSVSTTQNAAYNWSSPTVAGGHIYIGMASNCDVPLIRGGVREYDQASGALLHTHWTMSRGSIGASVWSSAAVTSTDVYVTTGNPLSTTSPQGQSYSIVDLAPGLRLRGIYTVPQTQLPGDSDFGASPVPFNVAGTPMVGACNKNGSFYAVNATTMTLAWQIKVDTHRSACLAAAIWDGTHLFIAGNATTINGHAYNGSLREVNPATGATIWQTGLSGGVVGTPSVSASGVIAVATLDPTNTTNGTYLIDASDGSIIRELMAPNNANEFAQPVFADGYLLTATEGAGLVAYH